MRSAAYRTCVPCVCHALPTAALPGKGKEKAEENGGSGQVGEFVSLSRPLLLLQAEKNGRLGRVGEFCVTFLATAITAGREEWKVRAGGVVSLSLSPLLLLLQANMAECCHPPLDQHGHLQGGLARLCPPALEETHLGRPTSSPLQVSNGGPEPKLACSRHPGTASKPRHTDRKVD